MPEKRQKKENTPKSTLPVRKQRLAKIKHSRTHHPTHPPAARWYTHNNFFSPLFAFFFVHRRVDSEAQFCRNCLVYIFSYRKTRFFVSIYIFCVYSVFGISLFFPDFNIIIYIFFLSHFCQNTQIQLFFSSSVNSFDGVYLRVYLYFLLFSVLPWRRWHGIDVWRKKKEEISIFVERLVESGEIEVYRRVVVHFYLLRSRRCCFFVAPFLFFATFLASFFTISVRLKVNEQINDSSARTHIHFFCRQHKSLKYTLETKRKKITTQITQTSNFKLLEIATSARSKQAKKRCQCFMWLGIKFCWDCYAVCEEMTINIK